MKSDIIMIDHQGHGFEESVEETKKVATYRNLSPKQTMRFQLLTEEMLSLASSVTGEMSASFWIESEGLNMVIHMTTKTALDREMRDQLISVTSSRKNEITHTFLGRLRNLFDEARASEHDAKYDIPYDVIGDLVNHPIESLEWDGYERSILRRLADNVKIAIRGGEVDITVSKNFSE